MSRDATDDKAPWPSFALPRDTAVHGYRIERVLGSGGFGITYLAYDMLRQPFAIKEYYPRQFAIRQDLTVMAATAEDVQQFEECRDRFLREAQALVLLGRAASTSDSIVRVQTYFEARGTCFLVMDYIEGTSLASVLREEPNGLTAARVHSLLRQLLTSIRVVHQAGLMHRDIKPANIIVRDGDTVVLIDFGSSRPAANTEFATYTQIYSGGYAPPEQMLGTNQGEFSDIYAIGAVAYRAIGGSVVNALARQNALAAGNADPQPSAERIGAGRYPQPLLTTIDAALALDPAQRLQTVDAMLAALGRDEPAEDPTVVAPNRVSPPAPPPRRRGVWAAAAAAGILALCATAYFELRGPATSPSASRREIVPPSPPHVEPPQQVPPAAQGPAAGDAAPQSTAARGEPEVAPTVSPAPSPPVEPAQREAVVMPPPTSPLVPHPPTRPSPLELGQMAALSVPCSVLNVANAQDGIRISGLATADPKLDQVLADLRNATPVTDDITRTDRFVCGPIAVIKPYVQRSRNGTPPAFAIRLDQQSVASGSRLGLKLTATPPALYIDLYQADGSVRHLSRPFPGVPGKPQAEWFAGLPAGPRLIVAIGAATSLDLGTRPETERAANYLTALGQRLERTAEPPAADFAMVTVRAAEPAVAKVPLPRATPLRSDRCANIVSRAQLGETLSDAELTALRTECRS
jgi:serine/threonine protein kinase